MKVWVKLLIGAMLGMTIGFLLPSESQRVFAVFQWLEKLVMNIGHYAVVPVLVFSLTIAVYELRLNDQFWPMLIKNCLLIIAAAVLVISLGIVTTLFFSPGRIPIETVEQFETFSLNTSENIMDLFPTNMLSVLAGGGIFIFPVCVFAFFLGMGLNYDRTYSKPVISMIDSLSRVFYHIASFFSELFGFFIIVLSAYWAVRFHEILDTKVFRNLVLMLGAFSVTLCFGLLPLFLYFIRPKTNPWLVLYGSLGPALTAFFSADVIFSIPVLQRHLKENFGVRRRSGALSLSLFSTFCRCGSAMVAVVAFIVIIKSYSFLNIPAITLVSIGLRALVISFLLARHPGNGAYIALAAICTGHGDGEYQAGYLILKPLVFYLASIGAFIDVTIGAFGAYMLARANGFIEEKNLVHFI
jgi:Na+/H+-dicarboxylate symporter